VDLREKGMGDVVNETAKRSHAAKNTDPYDAGTERTYLNGRDRALWDISTCPRCGVIRHRRAGQPRNQICVDCRTVENPGPRIARKCRPEADEEPTGVLIRDGLI